MLRYVLFPGRHHLLTRFQARYLTDLLAGRLSDTDGVPIQPAEHTEVVWAVTSANHQNTRRNPIPAHRREAAIELFGHVEKIISIVVPVLDVPPTDRFAEITIKAVEHATHGRIVLTPADTVVACSTPAVAELYRRLGFRIAAVEGTGDDHPAYPWALLEQLAAGDESWRDDAHPATLDVIDRYALDQHVQMIAADPMVSTEGSLTATRDYRSYSRSFEDAAQRKWVQARPFLQPGRIVDIGCATGAMLELASRDPALTESDLIGIEVAQHLYAECEHKLAQGLFGNPNTFFYQRNILTGAVFPARSIDSTLTFALTHEIYSYGDGLAEVRRFAGTIAAHTAPGGVWINSDVCGPDDPTRTVRLRFGEGDVATPAVDLRSRSSAQIQTCLDALPAASRLAQFRQDFRRSAGAAFDYTVIDGHTVELALADAMEFLSKYSYTGNWLSEMHEQFCALSWVDWLALAESLGFVVDSRSGAWRNDWLVQHRFAAVADLLDPAGHPVDWPVTHLLLVARRPTA